jgi:hypothetical protein
MWQPSQDHHAALRAVVHADGQAEEGNGVMGAGHLREPQERQR